MFLNYLKNKSISYFSLFFHIFLPIFYYHEEDSEIFLIDLLMFRVNNLFAWLLFSLLVLCSCV